MEVMEVMEVAAALQLHMDMDMEKRLEINGKFITRLGEKWLRGGDKD